MNQLMEAIEISQPGEPEVLKPCQRPIPEPREGEVLIQVAATGINRPDIMQRRGLYPPPPGASDLPGLEISGHVVKNGPGTSLASGTRVCALITGGGYAEFAVAKEALCLPIPERVTLEQAAALPETFFTVWHNLFQRARIQAGERLFIHGAGGGIGTTATQLAAQFNMEVFASTSSEEKKQYLLQLGAKAVMDYRQDDYLDFIDLVTEQQGVNVILNMLGGDSLQLDLKAAALEGRILCIAFQQGAKVQLNLMPLLLKRLSLLGSTLRAQSTEQKAVIAQELRQQVWPKLAQGQLLPHIERIFALDQAAEAHRMMESGQHLGKLILKV